MPYKAMKVISSLIRMFLLPNPFQEIQYGFLINIFIAEPLLHIVVFRIVGIVYKRGKAPAIGSLLYLAVYWGLVMFLTGVFT